MADDGLVPLTIATLRRAGWYAERLHAGTAYGGRMHLAYPGAPDAIAVNPFRRVWVSMDSNVKVPEVVLVECKRRKGKLRAAQLRLKKWCEDNGVRYVVVRTADDIARLVEGRGR